MKRTQEKSLKLAQAIRLAQSDFELTQFLKDMLTDGEIEKLVTRWNVALQIANIKVKNNQTSQRHIAESTPCTETVVGNVKRHVFGERSTGVAQRIAIEVVKGERA